MQNYEAIRIEQDTRGVAKLVLSRPEKHNAFDGTVIRELAHATAQLASDPSVRVVVLASEGKSFCAGGDLAWMREQVKKDPEARVAEAMILASMLRDLDSLPKPLIGRVQGPAYGGGVGLVSVCDVVVASPTARFALTEVRLGLIPATIGPYVVRRLGEGHARTFFFSAKAFDAAKAQAIGLVSHISPNATVEALDEAVEAEVSAFLQCAPGAIADSKALCQELARDTGKDHRFMTAQRLSARWATEEASDGIRCFFAHEAPPWAVITASPTRPSKS